MFCLRDPALQAALDLTVLRRENVAVKTLTVTKARANLGHWVKQAIAGKEIAIVQGAEVVALRRIPIAAADYAEQEYGLTPKQINAAAKRITADSRKMIAAGDYISGEQLVRELKRRHQPSGKKARRKTRSG